MLGDEQAESIVRELREVKQILAQILTRWSFAAQSFNMSAIPSTLVGNAEPLPRPTMDGVVTSVVDVWQAEHRHTLDARYVAQVRSRLDALLDHSGKAHAGQITRGDVAAFLDHLATLGERGKPIGPKTYLNYLLMFSGFFAWAVRAELLKANPCVGMRAPKAVKRKRRAFTAAEVRALMARSAWPRSGLYRVLAVTGIRIGEARQIRRSNVRETDSPPTLVVPGQITKKKRDRVVVLDTETAAILARMLAGLEPQDFALKVPRYKTLQRDIVRAGIKPRDELDRTAGWHSFRRFLPTELAKQGVSAEVARAQLGHASVATTLEHYTDSGLQDLSNAVSLVANALCATNDRRSEKIVGKSLAQMGDISDTHGATPMTQIPAQIEMSAPCLPALGVATLAEGQGQTFPSADPSRSSAMGATGLEPVAPSGELLSVVNRALAAIETALSLVRVGSKGADRGDGPSVA